MSTWRIVSLILFMALASGCVPSNDPLRPPDEALAEMRAHGITISTSGGVFPDTFDDPRFAPRYVDLGRALYPYVRMTTSFGLYFSPDPDNAVLPEGIDPFAPFYTRFPYEFSFSVENGGEFVEVPQVEDRDDYFGEGENPNGYNGAVRNDCLLDPLILYGNFCLRQSGPVIPISATHVEFWFRKESERVLVNRVALENLTAWRKYVKPLIDQNADDGT